LPQEMKAPDFRPTLEAHLFLAPLYLKRGQHQQALRCLTKADAIPTKDACSHFRIGCLYQELNQHALALTHLGSSLKAGPTMGFHPSHPLPGESEILGFVAYSLLCLEQWAKASEVLQIACERGLPINEGWEWVAFRALKLDHPQISLKAYEKVLGAGGLSADGYCNLGMLYRNQGLSQKALSCYQAALKEDPTHQDARANAAHLFLSLGRHQDAKPLFQQLAGEGLREVDILLALTRIAVQERDWGTVRTTTQMLKDIPSLQDERDKLEGDLFYTSIAKEFALQGKPLLAKWAHEIALGLNDQLL